MPRPTLSELVRQLDQSVILPEERVKGIDECDADIARLSQDFQRLTVDFATVREKVTTLEKAIDQTTQRRWTLVVAIISAFLGGLLTLLIQFSLRALPK